MSSPKNTATAPARSWSVRGRLVGAAAIGFAVLVVIENVLFAVTGAQSYGAPIEDVLAYYAANRDAVANVSGLVALYLPLLLVFVTGLHGLVERRGGAGGRRVAAPRVGRGRDAVAHFRASQRPADRARALPGRARRADARVRAR